MKKNNSKKNNTGTALTVFEGKLPVGITKEEIRKRFERDLQRTVDGVTPRLPQIKILHAGALAFILPPDEKGKSERVDSFEGVIADQHRCNAYWQERFSESGGGNPPDCSSLDGIRATEQNGTETSCVECPHNKYGTAQDGGKGKACKNMKRFHIFMDGFSLPRRLTLPPTSIKEAEIFLSTLRDRNLPMTVMKVKFSLAPAKSSGGIEYSEIRLESLGQIESEQWWDIQKFLDQHLAQIRGQEIKADEYASEEENKETSEKPEVDREFFG